jgi:stringent starvation protein B
MILPFITGRALSSSRQVDKTMDLSPPDKETAILQLLAEGDTMLCFDARHKGVRVPAEHALNPALRLILNLNFPHPIDVTAEGISARLSFGGRRIACHIPLDALWAAFDPQTMQGMMWPDSMPPEVTADLANQQQQKQPGTAPPDKADRSERDHLVQGSKIETNEEITENPRQRGHLRIIK